VLRCGLGAIWGVFGLMSEQLSIFSSSGVVPLAARLRPRCLADFFGQKHLVGEGKPIFQAVEHGQLHSMILWGPPGVGKTTLARLLADLSGCRFESLSAVLAGVKDIRAAVDKARAVQSGGKQFVLFVDEVHRFNKAQQDAFLPFIEDGTFVFVGATTENPSFELNNALLSRARVYVLKALDESDVRQVLVRALSDSEFGLGSLGLVLDDDVLGRLVQASDGDARRALGMLEVLADFSVVDEGSGKAVVDPKSVDEVVKLSWRQFDKGGDLFYVCISLCVALIRMRLCIGVVGCWMVGVILSIWFGGWCGWLRRILVMPILVLCLWR